MEQQGKKVLKGVLYMAVLLNVLIAMPSMVLAQSSEPKSFDPDRVMVVPYRLPTISGEDIELRIHFKNRYKEVVQADFDVVLSKPDGRHVLELMTVEQKKIILTFEVEDKKVKGMTITTDDRPKAGSNESVLTLRSRSGESLYVIFEWAAGKVRNVTANSSRTGYSKPNE